MSDNVGSNGIMVPLNRKMTDEEREEMTEALWENEDGLVQINYEGTIAYTDHRSDGYGITFGISADDGDVGQISRTLNIYGFGIIKEQARPYSCYWYNGCDSDMDVMTLEKFLEETGQQ